MQLDKTRIKKIAVFRALQLGDILCAIPAIRNLRMNFPEAEITFIGLKGTEPLIGRFPKYIDKFVCFPGYPELPEQPFNQKEFDSFLTEMKSEAFDMLLQMQGNGTIVNKMLSAFKSKHLAGFSIDNEEQRENPLLMPYPNSGHESLRHLQLISFLGLEVFETAMEFPLSETDVRNFEAKRFPVKQRFICLHAGSRGSWRQWPPEYFAKIADVCSGRGFQVVLTGTPEELELTNEVAKKMITQSLVLAGQTDLGILGILLKRCAGLIANCTGISHIAAALQVPSVIISMDGEPERWAPLDRNLHYTIDWTKNPHYELVEHAVLKLLSRPAIPEVAP